MSENRMAHGYRAFGMVLRSGVPIHGLSPADGEPDMVLSVRRAGDAGFVHPAETAFRIGPQRLVIGWQDYGLFDISLGDPIRIDLSAVMPEHEIRFALLGPVMAMIQQCRGLFVLHASAVEVGGQGFAFLGDKGAGKSTSAAAVIAAGGRLLSDDVLAIAADRSPQVMLPGYPQMKLLHEAASAIATSERFTGHMDDGVKMNVGVAGAYLDAEIPVGALCVLERGAAYEAESLDARAGFSQLMRHSYLGRFESDVIAPEILASHVRQAAGLARTSRILKLTVPGDLRSLSRLHDTLAQWAQTAPARDPVAPPR